MENDIINSLKKENYHEVKIIQKSPKGIVMKALDEENKLVLLKTFYKKTNICTFIKEPKFNKLIPKELYFLEQLSLYDCVPKLIRSIDENDWSTVVMEYLGGDWMNLFDFTAVFIEENIVKTIIRKLITIVYEMSDIGYYHRDIKPENIMVNQVTFEVKLIDVEDLFYSESVNPHCNSLLGTLGFQSPETYSNEPCNLKQSLVCNIGCVAYFCLELRRPFHTKVETIKCNLPNMMFSSELAQSFIKNCIKIDPKKRIKFDNLLTHEWLDEQVKMKSYNPMAFAKLLWKLFNKMLS